MGRPKLLLPLEGRPLIAATIGAWRQSRVTEALVVVRPGDTELAEACRQCGATVVWPNAPPPDMKASVQEALRHIERALHPTPQDAFLVAPADMPKLSPAIINRLIEQHDRTSGEEILVPQITGQRGHPVLFPWRMADKVHQLAGEEGLNVLVDQGPLGMVPCDDLVSAGDQPFADIDTPADYRRLR
jgi:molybdenum cofactor cytidylyltransferase